MPARLIEVFVPSERCEPVYELLEQHAFSWSWSGAVEDMGVFKLVVETERVEEVVDSLQALLEATEGAHLLVLPLEAHVPRAPEPIPDESTETPERRARRISREELYNDLSRHAVVTGPFLAMTSISTVVAAVGVQRDSAAVVIGAMVIAPLLGPNMSLALGTTLGDVPLIGRALRANAIGVLVSLAVALAVGFLLDVDLASAEIVSRTEVTFGELLLALATGAAGALALTTGAASSLVGVMVAVALVPPLVVSAILTANGHFEDAGRALLLVASNVICVNLASVATFYVQGIRPRTWWEAESSTRAVRIALTVWLVLLALVAVIVAVAGVAPPVLSAD